MGYVTIVPPISNKGGPALTQGTRVILEDGSELKGVYKIVLSAECNSVWTAEIHCHPRMTDMSVSARIYRPKWWTRVWYWMQGTE